MGPNSDALEATKRDAIKTTLRHFRDDVEDNAFAPAVDLKKVEKDLLAEHSTHEEDQTQLPERPGPADNQSAAEKKGGSKSAAEKASAK